MHQFFRRRRVATGKTGLHFCIIPRKTTESRVTHERGLFHRISISNTLSVSQSVNGLRCHIFRERRIIHFNGILILAFLHYGRFQAGGAGIAENVAPQSTFFIREITVVRTHLFNAFCWSGRTTPVNFNTNFIRIAEPHRRVNTPVAIIRIFRLWLCLRSGLLLRAKHITDSL